MGRKPDVDGEHPELLEELQQPALRGQRQRHDEQVDTRLPPEGDEIGDAAELPVPGDARRRALVLPVVEDAADADVVVRLRGQRRDQVLGRLAAADDDGAALEQSLAGPAAHHAGKADTEAGEGDEPGHVPGGEPDAGEGVAHLGEERRDREQGEDQRPGAIDPADLRPGAAQRRDRVAARELDEDDGHQRGAEHGDGVEGAEARIAPDIEGIEREAAEGGDGEFDEPGEAGDEDRGERAAPEAVGDRLRLGRKLRVRRRRRACDDAGRHRLGVTDQLRIVLGHCSSRLPRMPPGAEAVAARVELAKSNRVCDE